MVQNNIRNDKEYTYDKAWEDLEKYIAEINKPIWDAFLHIIKKKSYEDLEKILEIAQQEDYRLKDEFIEEILINFKTEEAFKFLKIILSNNQRESKSIRTKILNKCAKESIQMNNEPKIENNQGFDQDNNQRRIGEEVKEQTKEEVKDEESREETKQRNSKSRSDKYIENEDSKKSLEDK